MRDINVEVFKRNNKIYLEILGVGGVEISNLDFIDKSLKEIIDKMEDNSCVLITNGKIIEFKVA